MENIYAIIYWDGDSNQIYPMMNEDGTIMTYNSLKDADVAAEAFEQAHGAEIGSMCRTISIGGVTDSYSEFDDNGTKKDCEYKSDCIRDCETCDFEEE